MSEEPLSGERGAVRRSRRAVWDLLVVALVAVGAWASAAAFDLYEAVDGWVHARGASEVDELFIVFDVLFLASAVFAYRRWREARSDLVSVTSVERSLRESEARFAMLASAATEAVVLHDRGTILEVNDVFCRIFAVDRRSVVGRVAFDFVAREDDDVLRDRIGSPRDDPYEITAMRADGTTFPARVTARSVPYQGRTVRVATIRDLTEEREAQEALRETEALYRSLVEQIPVATYIDEVDESSPSFVRTLYMSPQIEGMVGYSAEEFVSDPSLWARMIHPDDREIALGRDEEFYSEGSWSGHELRLIARDGRIVWVFDHSSMLPRTPGKPQLVQGIILDITERKLAEDVVRRRDGVLGAVAFAAGRFLAAPWEEAIEEVLERLGRAAGMSRVYVFENRIDEGTGDVLADQRFEWAAPGITPQIDNRDLQSFSYERMGFGDWYAAMREGKTVCALVRDLPTQQAAFLSEEQILSIAVVPVLVGGAPWGFIGFDDCASERDWTEGEVEALRAAAAALGAAVGRERAERALADAEARFRGLAEHIPAVTYRWHADPVTHEVLERYVSPQVREMLGYDPEDFDLEGGFWTDLVHPDDAEAVTAWEDEHEENAPVGRPFSMEYRLRARDGRPIWVQDREVVLERGPDGFPTLILGVMFDVTERKLAEQARREAEERHRSLVEQIDAVTYVEAPAVGNEVLYISPQVEEMFGFPVPRWLGRTDLWDRLIHPDDLPSVRAESDRTASSGDPFVMDYRMRTRGGDLKWVHEVSKLLRDGSGSPLYWQGVIFDITERKRAEDALREAEERFRTLVEQIPAVTYVWDSLREPGEGDFVYMSPQVEQMLGFPVERWLTETELWRRQVYPADHDRVVEAWRRTDVSSEPFDVEYRMIARDGRIVWVHDQAAVVEREEGGRPRLWQGVLFDVTDRKRIEQERHLLLTRLVQAQEEERRRIASDIHDDPVQKMTAVGLRLEALRKRIDDPQLRDRFGQLEQTVGSSIRGLRHLLFELRPPVLDREGLAAALRQYLDQTASGSGLDVELENELVDEPPLEVRTLAYRIAQEAITNARKHASARTVSVALEPRSGGLYVRVSDDGRGFALEDGNGRPGHLGMPAMRERAELAGGWWRMASQVGRGTTVEFWLPTGSAEA